jgi:CheY-like chemotaxis protein
MGGLMRILIVDDNASFRLLLSDMIGSNSGHTFIHSSEPLDALDKIKNADLVICDYYMPNDNGEDLIEIINRNNRYIKCIIVSGDDSTVERLKRKGIVSYSKLDLKSLMRYILKISDIKKSA